MKLDHRTQPPLSRSLAIFPVTLFAIAAATAPLALAQVYNLAPDWSSADMQVSTGGALVDLNRDGWLDLVVANGNDISLQKVVVYYNNGAGVLQTSPGWQSAANRYHGHCDIADVNGDGWPDIAVAVLLPQGGPAAHVYLNNGSGMLLTTPSWSASITADTFGLAFGDMNGDGRPDLSLASGDAYSNIPTINVVYLNTGATLAATPSWQTSVARNYGNCIWTDADRDGRLDLVMCGTNSPTHVYRNLGTTLSTAPNYASTDSTAQFCLMAAAGDVNGDGYRELFIADNNQLFSGTGRFRQYNGLSAGFYATTAAWTYSDGYTAAVALGDINNDGRLDLCTGEWFGRTRYFLNTGTGTGLPAAPTWTNTGTATTTVEKIVLGDVNNTSRKVRVFTQAALGGRKLVELPVMPVQDVLGVQVDGVDLAPSQYTWSREQGWVAVGVAPASSIKVAYVQSRSLDMAVTNWDDNRPNQLYYNKTTPPCPSDFDDSGFVDFDDFNAFVVAFEAGDPTADFDVSGFVDFDDFNKFVQQFELGC